MAQQAPQPPEAPRQSEAQQPTPTPQQQVVYVERQGNGLAVASLVLGIVGAVMGLIPLTGFIAIICGLLGVIFGFVGWRKASSGAGRKGMAIAGLILSAIALTLGVVGLVIMNDAVNELDRELNKLG
jgi:hypothetical protein